MDMAQQGCLSTGSCTGCESLELFPVPKYHGEEMGEGCEEGWSLSAGEGGAVVAGGLGGQQPGGSWGCVRQGTLCVSP